jgi:hypothetical protein
MFTPALTPAPTATPTPQPITEWIQIAKDGRGFMKSPSNQKFVVWGFNYGIDEQNRLLEDYWDAEWSKVVEDFREMKTLGANVVRIFLQVGKFMTSPTQPNETALNQLARLVALAEQEGLYLDLTGLSAFRKANVPAWYHARSEKEHWEAQARFWGAIAARVGHSPAIFCYNLMNEPIAPAGRKNPDDLLNGEFAGFHFVQYLSLDQAGRPTDEIARQWIRQMTAAIRQHDHRHLITVGALPPSPQLGYFSGFVPDKIVGELDFLSAHVYPRASKVSDAIQTVKDFAVGKPVVIEETSGLYCSAQEFEEFIKQSKSMASGWLGFYTGRTPEQLRPPKNIHDAVTLKLLELFLSLRAEVMR